MITIRPAQWPDDIAAVAAIDASFQTDRIYRLIQEGLSVRFTVETVVPTLKKQYDVDVSEPAERETWHFSVIAEVDGAVVGFAAAEHVQWNNRVLLKHLYVSSSQRRSGIGHNLIDAVDAFARSVHARCLWLETQNVNHGAIQFYQSEGFQFCGFDTSLYAPNNGLVEGEVAVFFVRAVQQFS